jgi:hypothetical protein
MTKTTFVQLLQEPESVDRNRAFLMSCIILSMICTLQAEEKQHSARWNRTRSAEEAAIRMCDIYLPEGLDKARLVSIFDVVDGPVSDVIRRHAGLMLDAVAEATQC